MAQKRRGPVLLELVGERKEPPPRAIPRGPEAPPQPAPVTRIDAPPIGRAPLAPTPAPTSQPAAAPLNRPVDAEEAPGSLKEWLSPGRTVRMPAGYLFFFVAIAASVFALGWALGHRSAVARQKADRAAAVERELDAAATREPLFETNAAAPTGSSTYPPVGVPGTGGPSQPAGASRGPTGGAGGAGSPALAGPIVPEADPRQPGLNYWIVIRCEPEVAARAAQFLRDNSVLAFAWPEPDPKFHTVVALPGFERGALSSPDTKRLGEEIRRLGRVWKAERRGPTDFASAYLKKQEASR